MLVLIDGEPELRDVPGSGLKSVVNKPLALIFDPKTKNYYTSNGNFWYATPDLFGEWKTIPKPPAEVEKLATEAKKAAPEEPGGNEAEAEAKKKYGNRPIKLVVSTEPAELLSFDGAPSYVPLAGTELLYAKNTENDVFKSVETQETYVLFSGRWYSCKNLSGPWTYVPADKLPADFGGAMRRVDRPATTPPGRVPPRPRSACRV